ncbi:hypothetical protein, partial [Salmonella enterica]|uniref:hypothetical protein n=1 Tax=Salmonella enterica TaxID=28901 RepID=UPI0035262512
LAGTVEYNMDGAQTFLTKGASGVAIPSLYGSLILSTSGVKTLSYNTTVNTSYELKGTATLGLGGFTFTNYALPNVVTLEDIKVDGETIPNFVRTTETYNMQLDYGRTAIPVITYSTS